MIRLVLAMLGGIVAWTLIASLLNIGLRLALPGYSLAEPEKTFTVAMQLARLVVGAVASLAGGAAAGWIGRPAGPSVWILAILLLAAFIPMHVALWALFPVWYHLTFLLSLAPLTVLGSLLGHKREPQPSQGDEQRAAG